MAESIPSEEILGTPSIKMGEPPIVASLWVEFELVERPVSPNKFGRTSTCHIPVTDLKDANGKVRAQVGEALTKFLQGDDS